MRIMNPFIILFLLLPLSVNAEVFKCKSLTGALIYQPTPCTPGEIPQGRLKIKEMTPEAVEKANALRKAEEQEEAAYEADKAKAEKERQLALTRQKEMDLVARRTKAQEDAAQLARNRMWRPPQPIYK